MHAEHADGSVRFTGRVLEADITSDRHGFVVHPDGSLLYDREADCADFVRQHNLVDLFQKSSTKVLFTVKAQAITHQTDHSACR
jgi:hypothetical protein